MHQAVVQSRANAIRYCCIHKRIVNIRVTLGWCHLTEREREREREREGGEIRRERESDVLLLFFFFFLMLLVVVLLLLL